jgi:hypothetical protein
MMMGYEPPPRLNINFRKLTSPRRILLAGTFDLKTADELTANVR